MQHGLTARSVLLFAYCHTASIIFPFSRLNAFFHSSKNMASVNVRQLIAIIMAVVFLCYFSLSFLRLAGLSKPPENPSILSVVTCAPCSTKPEKIIEEKTCPPTESQHSFCMIPPVRIITTSDWDSWQRDFYLNTIVSLLQAKVQSSTLADYYNAHARQGKIYDLVRPTVSGDLNFFDRIGRQFDGGKWMYGLSFLPSACIIYSLGSAGDYSFEMDVLARTKGNCTVCSLSHQFQKIAAITCFPYYYFYSDAWLYRYSPLTAHSRISTSKLHCHLEFNCMSGVLVKIMKHENTTHCTLWWTSWITKSFTYWRWTLRAVNGRCFRCCMQQTKRISLFRYLLKYTLKQAVIGSLESCSTFWTCIQLDICCSARRLIQGLLIVVSWLGLRWNISEMLIQFLMTLYQAQIIHHEGTNKINDYTNQGDF